MESRNCWLKIAYRIALKKLLQRAIQNSSLELLSEKFSIKEKKWNYKENILAQFSQKHNLLKHLFLAFHFIIIGFVYIPGTKTMVQVLVRDEKNSIYVTGGKHICVDNN